MRTLTIRAALCLAPLALMAPTRAAELNLPKDGWASWEVQAVEDAPDMCCWSDWKKGENARTACKLDDDRSNWGNRDDGHTDAVRVYARVAGGKVERVRAFSASCKVESEKPIQDLGTVAADDSARWLMPLTKTLPEFRKHGDLVHGALAALALHHGDVAYNGLVTLARGDNPLELRKNAVFWLANLRGIPGAELTTDVMFNDAQADVRKHAAFALTISDSPRIAADLTRLGNTDKDGDVRAQAWFWLAHTKAPEAEAAISAALRKDTSTHVREHAIFALSQLPDERGTKALIAVAEDQSLTREQRKKAVFWLAQSNKDSAQAYLEKVLAGNATH